jgi:hypothetical protein
VGAWIADLLLLVFGLSAWLWVAAGVAWVVRGFRRLHAPYTDHGLPDWAQALGLVLLIATSTALEALRLQGLASVLPGASGGIIGGLLAQPLASVLGFTAASVLLIVGVAIGASLFFDFSWLTVAERVGLMFERVVQRMREKREAEEDRAIGRRWWRSASGSRRRRRCTSSGRRRAWRRRSASRRKSRCRCLPMPATPSCRCSTCSTSRRPRWKRSRPTRWNSPAA